MLFDKSCFKSGIFVLKLKNLPKLKGLATQRANGINGIDLCSEMEMFYLNEVLFYLSNHQVVLFLIVLNICSFILMRQTLKKEN